MKAFHAIYHEGNIQFVFNLPEIHGPVSVLVIFPCQEESGLLETVEDEEEFQETRITATFASALEARNDPKDQDCVYNEERFDKE